VNAFEKKGVGGGTTKLLRIDTEAGMQLFFANINLNAHFHIIRRVT